MMKSISAEDNDDMMRYNRNIAAVLLVVATIILLSSSLFITSASVSDTDPSTYVVVPLLMLPLFLLFSLKSKPEPAVDKRSALIGAVGLMLFIVLAIALRLYFTLFFISFRIDMLLMPLALASLISLLFGAANIQKFRGALVYSLLASPIVLYPLLTQFNAFTQANSYIVYSFLKPLVGAVQYAAPITISANGYSIAIGQACVSIGTFIALALFLIPVAYFYDGTIKKKVLWTASGIALLLVLNIARMLGISAVWLSYGPNATALLIHNFIGIVLFYAVIVVLILATKYYGLTIERRGREKRKQSHMQAAQWPIVAAFVFSLLYLAVTLNYSSALIVSPLLLQHTAQFNYSNHQAQGAIGNLISNAHFTFVAISSPNGTSTFITLTNNTINAAHPILVFLSSPNSNVLSGISANNTILGEMHFFNTKGAGEQVLDIISNNTEFLVYDTNLELSLSNSSEMAAGAYVIIPKQDLPRNTSPSCDSYDPLYSWIYSLPVKTSYNQTVRGNILDAQCFSYSLLWA
ncbi:MAG: archaeosortase/exosortase family protein [Candidatus Micrarchaeota archaeon]|nr:archaeosortase/exosortase family protein [Candidatus Micrarchaeota archaeon]